MECYYANLTPSSDRRLILGLTSPITKEDSYDIMLSLQGPEESSYRVLWPGCLDWIASYSSSILIIDRHNKTLSHCLELL